MCVCVCVCVCACVCDISSSTTYIISSILHMQFLVFLTLWQNFNNNGINKDIKRSVY